MKKFYEVGSKMQWVEFINEIIIDASCTCEDFMYRKLYKQGEKVRIRGFCKHLRVVCNVYNHDKLIQIRGLDESRREGE